MDTPTTTRTYIEVPSPPPPAPPSNNHVSYNFTVSPHLHSDTPKLSRTMILGLAITVVLAVALVLSALWFGWLYMRFFLAEREARKTRKGDMLQGRVERSVDGEEGIELVERLGRGSGSERRVEVVRRMEGARRPEGWLDL